MDQIIFLKLRFFAIRLLTYFSLLLLPIGIQKLLPLHISMQFFLIIVYVFFLFSQFYLLAKEIDHRFKIHVKTNSSLDRTLYRFFIGQAIMLIYFNLLYILVPASYLHHFFWGTWIVLGLYYSWPTRGKIIQESMNSDFSEFRYLDGFEKTTFFLILITVLLSAPTLPYFRSIEVLKLYLDPHENVHETIWNFTQLIALPFWKYPILFRLSQNLYFYFTSVTFFLLAVYSLTRFVFSRRISILAVYAIVSSWSFSKLMEWQFLDMTTTTISMLWMWCYFWCIRSANYRAGFILGIFNYWATLWNPTFYLLYWVQFILLFFVNAQQMTLWYKKQFFRYSSIGGILATFAFVTHKNPYLFQFKTMITWWNVFSTQLFYIISEKSFYTIAPFGLLYLAYIAWQKKINSFAVTLFAHHKMRDLGQCFVVLMILSFISSQSFLSQYFLLPVIVFFIMILIEKFFQIIQDQKSHRNFIYLIYILFCLLDSNLEGRLKIILAHFYQLNSGL